MVKEEINYYGCCKVLLSTNPVTKLLNSIPVIPSLQLIQPSLFSSLISSGSRIVLDTIWRYFIWHPIALHTDRWTTLAFNCLIASPRRISCLTRQCACAEIGHAPRCSRVRACDAVTVINPRCACAARVTVLALCVCVSVCVCVCVSFSSYSRATGAKPAHERYQRL